MAHCVVSIGSNIERERHIRAALDELRRHYGAVAYSSVYESSAVGFRGEPFFNLVAGFESGQDVHAVNETLHAIEERYGRDRSGPRFASRTLDLDLLLYDDLIRADDTVEVPRGEIAEQAFVLLPLAELYPDRRHPRSGRSFAAMWRAFDKGGLDIHPIDFTW